MEKKHAPNLKAEGGLTEILYVRTTPDLVKGLDVLVARRQRLSPKPVLSRSDVARALLYKALKQEGIDIED